jgi:hypothetical protein
MFRSVHPEEVYPLTNRELKIVDPRPTYHVPRTPVPGTLVTVSADEESL